MNYYTKANLPTSGEAIIIAEMPIIILEKFIFCIIYLII